MGFIKGFKNAVSGNHSHKEPKPQPQAQAVALEAPKHQTSTLKQIVKTTASIVKTTASVAVKTTKIAAKTGVVATKAAKIVAKPALAVAKHIVAPTPSQPAQNPAGLGLALEKRQWFKDLGFKVLAKIYEPDATPGNQHQAGSVAQSFANVFEASGLKDKEVTRPLYHQANRQSLTKVVKKVNRFFRGDSEHVKARQDYLTQVASVVWAAQEQAKLNGENFERGSIKIKDPDGKLFAFLKGYVQFATGKENPGYLFSSNDFAYSRDPKNKLSSHYTKFETEQYGIDMRFTGASPTLEILPNKGDAHLLFGRIKINNEWHTFIKGEPAGLGHPLEYLEHAGHFLFPKKHHGVARKESDVPKPLKEAYEKFYQANGGVKAKTVSDMYQQMINADNLSDKAYRAKEQFFKAIEHLNFTQDILIRTGNEVILDFHTFEQEAPLAQPHRPMVARPQVDARSVGPIVAPHFPQPVVVPVQVDEPIARRLRSRAQVASQQRAAQSNVPVAPVHPRPIFNTSIKWNIVGGLLGVAGVALTGFSLTPLIVMSGFLSGFLLTQVVQNDRVNQKYSALEKYDDKSVNSLKFDGQALDAFELGVSAASSYTSQAKSFITAFGNSQAYYAGMAAKEAGRDDMIAKVASAKRPQR